MIDYFARHPTAANLLMAALILIGVLALPDLQRETYPEFESDVVQVRASYPGADAQTMDELVVARIEDVLGGLEGVETVSASAREGSASVSVEVADGYDIEALVTDIESAVDDASGDDGWATLGMVGHVLVKRMPDFDPRNYGYKKLSDLVTDVASMEVRRDETPNGPSIMVRVKPVTSHGRR